MIMKTFADLNDKELNLTVEAAENAKERLSQNELIDLLDKLVMKNSKEGIIYESGLDEINFETLLAQSEDFIQKNKALNFNEEGLFGFNWENFNDKAKKIICKNKVIIDFMQGKGTHTLKSTLKDIIPIIVSVLGFGALNPIALAIVIGILAIIASMGFNAYCDL